MLFFPFLFFFRWQVIAGKRAFTAGRYHRVVITNHRVPFGQCVILINMFFVNPPNRLLFQKKRTNQRYVSELSRSTFCLVPPGTALWTFRFSEAILAGCIPVLFDNRRQL